MLNFMDHSRNFISWISVIDLSSLILWLFVLLNRRNVDWSSKPRRYSPNRRWLCSYLLHSLYIRQSYWWHLLHRLLSKETSCFLYNWIWIDSLLFGLIKNRIEVWICLHWGWLFYLKWLPYNLSLVYNLFEESSKSCNNLLCFFKVLL